MLRVIRLTAILTVSSFAILAVPFAGGAGSLNLPGFSAIAAKGGNGGGNNDSGGSGGGQSNGKSGESHGSSATSGAGATVQSSGSKKPTAPQGTSVTAPKGTSAGVSVAGKKAPAAKKSSTELSERNFHAQLAGLNSLKRNVNGLMNSSDPRMEGIRAFVQAGAALEVAIAELEKATVDLGNANDAYLQLVESLGLEPYDGNPDAYEDLSVSGLQARLTELEQIGLVEDNAEYDAWQAEIAKLEAAIETLELSPELSELEAAIAAFAAANEAVETAEAEVGDGALREALLLAANDNRVAQYGEEYVTDEILGWAKSVLGVGDANGAIDAYLAQQ